jgi:hypothetical protein
VRRFLRSVWGFLSGEYLCFYCGRQAKKPYRSSRHAFCDTLCAAKWRQGVVSAADHLADGMTTVGDLELPALTVEQRFREAGE